MDYLEFLRAFEAKWLLHGAGSNAFVRLWWDEGSGAVAVLLEPSEGGTRGVLRHLQPGEDVEWAAFDLAWDVIPPLGWGEVTEVDGIPWIGGVSGSLVRRVTAAAPRFTCQGPVNSNP